MRFLADTNVLVRLLNPADAQQAVVLAALERLDRTGHEACIVPQVLYELWVVYTRPAVDNGLEYSPEEAHAAIQQVCRFFSLLRDERGVYDRWLGLAVQATVRGKAAHDARIAAAMQRHGVRHLMTFNPRRF
jgi:predicted nucleic acid-binding protein